MNKLKKIKLLLVEFAPHHPSIWIFVVLLIAFTGSAIFFAMNLERGIVPDEPAHFILSQHFSTTLGIPPDVPQTYRLGYIGHKPFLYYWLNGRFLNMIELFYPDISNWRQLVFLRLLNVVYSILTVIFGYLLSKEIFENRWWQLFPSFLLTNTLMFAFLSGGVNYDNLTNLCAFAGIYFLLRIINEKSFYENSMGYLIFTFTNSLIQIKALPLALITGIIWILYVIKNRKRIAFPSMLGWKPLSLLTILIFLLSINFSIWGINLIKYQSITPPCNKILTENQCNLSPFVARSQQLNLPQKLTLVTAIREKYPDPVEYTWDYWTLSMLKRIYGIMGHKSYFPTLIITFYRLLIIWVILTAIQYRIPLTDKIGSLIVIFVFYSIVLLTINYNGELITGFKHVAIQGRYIFPVIGIAYMLMVYCVSKIPNIIIRRATILYTVVLFLWGSPLLLLTNLPLSLADWFV